MMSTNVEFAMSHIFATVLLLLFWRTPRKTKSLKDGDCGAEMNVVLVGETRVEVELRPEGVRERPEE